MNKTYTFAGSENECKGLYDENGNLIREWQEGDEIYRVFRDVLSHFGVNLSYKDLGIRDGEMSSKI